MDDESPEDGEPRRTVHIGMAQFNGKSISRAGVVQGFRVFDLLDETGMTYESFLTPALCNETRSSFGFLAHC